MLPQPVCTAPPARNNALAVVVNATASDVEISKEDLKLIYQRKALLDKSGQRWLPVNLSVGDPLRREFSLSLFGSLPEDQQQYWNDQYFHGITPPIALASEEAVLRFVAMTPGAIGYVHAQAADTRVKVIFLLPAP